MGDTELLSERECRETFDRVMRAAKAAGAPDVELTLGATRSGLTRFANNAIHQNVSERRRSLSVRAVVGKRTGRATTNRFGEEAIRSTVDEAVAIARAAAPDPDLQGLAEPAEYRSVDRFCPSTAQSTPEERADAGAEAIAIVEGAGQTAAGMFSASESAEAIVNAQGVFATYRDTLAQFSITAMADNSSGWAKASTPDCGNLDPAGLARRAREKAALSKNPRAIDAGRYTVILEPAAVQDLIGQMFFDFSATAIRDQRSFLTGRLGKQVFGTGINIADDVFHPMQSGAPFDGEGVPRRRLALVEDGVPREIAYSRNSAARDGAAPTGHGFALPNEYGEAPMNIVIEGGGHTLEEMIAGTKRGVLVTRVWYIREVDPYEKIMTGLTRDGTFLVEGGRVVCGLRNFRFNQSLVELLRNVEMLSAAERASGEEAFDMVVPAMRVGEFTFSEVTPG